MASDGRSGGAQPGDVVNQTETATVLFTDLAGSTALRVRLGEDGADALRRVHDALLTAEVVERRGRVVKGGGDGIMATFGSSSDAVVRRWPCNKRSIATTTNYGVLAPLEVRVGLSVGDVSWEDGDCFGLPVVEAARLEAAAQPCQIVCSHLVELIDPWAWRVPVPVVGSPRAEGSAGTARGERAALETCPRRRRICGHGHAGDGRLGRNVGFPLTSERVTVGSLSSSDIALGSDRTVSRRHAVLERQATGWTLRDLDSCNGTFVNGQRLSGLHHLDDGDRIQLGNTALVFSTRQRTERSSATEVVRPAPEVTDGQRALLDELCLPLWRGGAFAEPASVAEISARLHRAPTVVEAELALLALAFGVEGGARRVPGPGPR